MILLADYLGAMPCQVGPALSLGRVKWMLQVADAGEWQRSVREQSNVCNMAWP